jgi:hypothetical protein
MSVERGQDRCRECDSPLKHKGPCPNCGATGRIKYGNCNIQVSTSLSADAKLIVSWQEVDRLQAKREFAAALLVAAVNIEFILWERLRSFAAADEPDVRDPGMRSTWGQIRGDKSDKVTLSSLFKVAKYIAANHGFTLDGAWRDAVKPINTVRNWIVHERGYFAQLTQLKNSDWPEHRIRKVLADAKVFCHGNGESRHPPTSPTLRRRNPN